MAKVVPLLCPHCTYWCTLNELNGFAMCGWVAGVHPPGKKDDPIMMIRVIKHMLDAHVAAVKIIRAESGSCVQLSGPSKGSGATPITMLATSHVLFTPMPGWGPLALLASVIAVVVQYLFNFLYHDMVVYGRVAWAFYPVVWAFGWLDDLRALKGTVDVIGINHYYRSVVRLTGESMAGRVPGAGDLFLALPFGYTITALGMDNFEKSDFNWDLTPSSMERFLRVIWARYKMPMMVTESGCADREDPDDRRTRYLAGVFGVAHKLRTEGVDLRGYLVWTLLDNFEWAEGINQRFGLLHNDFKTQTRSERASSTMIKKLTGVYKGGSNGKAVRATTPKRAAASPQRKRK